MRLDRRTLIAGMGAAALPWRVSAAEVDTTGLLPLPGTAVPIDRAERERRIERAQRLMRDHGIAAIVIEPGASLTYFTGVAWWRSERLTAAVIPAAGAPVIVCPFFEEPSVRESLAIPAEIRVWQEDESPLTLIAAFLAERGATGAVGIEETVRFFAVDGLRQRMPGARIVSADPVVRGCRMVKSPAEIALMQRATDITVAAYRWMWPRVREGMGRDAVAALMDAATVALGGRPAFSLVLLGEAAAYPHGSGRPQQVREGEVVLMDCGCMVEGYQSDVSRTMVPGRAPADVARVFADVQAGQRAAFAAARIGATAGSVDDAVRAVYEARGYGPGYRLPGLSHRTGHGIGLDGHEPVNLVRGETTRLAAGMCFSNEPGLYLPGRFGVRIEDCFHMAETGPVWFSQPQRGLDAPTA